MKLKELFTQPFARKTGPHIRFGLLFGLLTTLPIHVQAISQSPTEPGIYSPPAKHTITPQEELRVENPHFVVIKKNAPLRDCRELFIEAWVDNYRETALAELNPSFSNFHDFRDHLEKIFNAEEKLIHDGKAILIKAFQNDMLVGWIIFQPEPREKNSVYIKDLVVKPGFQRMGIGRHLIFSLKKIPTLFPNTENIFAVFRRINHKARAFYKKYGFHESSYTQEGYDPDKFVGFEWHGKLD